MWLEVVDEVRSSTQVIKQGVTCTDKGACVVFPPAATGKSNEIVEHGISCFHLKIFPILEDFMVLEAAETLLVFFLRFLNPIALVGAQELAIHPLALTLKYLVDNNDVGRVVQRQIGPVCFRDNRRRNIRGRLIARGGNEGKLVLPPKI